jgi:hypothetical protein
VLRPGVDDLFRYGLAAQRWAFRRMAGRKASLLVVPFGLKPAGAFAAVHYRDHWFWIDQGDWPTKRALTAAIFFFTLTWHHTNPRR